MAVVTGTGASILAVWDVLTAPFTVQSSSDTSFTVENSFGTVTVTGSGFNYNAVTLPNGTVAVSLTGGTITGVQQNLGPANQTWSGFSVSGVAAFNALGTNSTTFGNLFFSGNDTFTLMYGDAIGYDGNDTFNISNWNAGSTIDGGNGNDTLNVTGGIGIPAGLPSNVTDFNINNVETVNLAAGYSYTITAGFNEVTAGNTQTVDASALGASDHFSFFSTPASRITDHVPFQGNIVLLGGAGDDIFQGGSGNNVINGGAGNDTVTFDTGQLAYSGTAGVTVSLSNSGPQSVGGPIGGTYTLSGIENLTGTAYSDVLTGDAGDNILNGDGGGNDIFDGMGGNDILQGSANGTDTAIYAGPASSYIITHNGTVTTISGPEGTDILTGIDFAQFSDQTVAIAGISVTTSNLSASHGQMIPLSNLFSVTDIEGPSLISEFQLFDGNDDPASGHFIVNGVVQPAKTVITVATFDSVFFQAGYVNDTLQIRALDVTGHASAGVNDAWAPFTVSVPVNHAPVLTTSNISTTHGQSLAAPSLVSVSDPDGDPITAYEVFDGNNDPASGYFYLYGTVLPARTVVDLTASDFSSLTYVAGSVGDTLQIRASDGNAWSAGANDAWAPFTVTVPVNHPPVVTTSNISAAHGQTLALSSLFSVSDADGDAMKTYQLFDGNSDPSSGHFVIFGQAQPARTVITVSAGNLSGVSFLTGASSDSLQIRASDGYDWSAGANDAWAPFTVTVPTNHPPVVTTSNISAAHGQTLALSSLFSVSDADGDAITAYELFDGNSDPSSGHFVVNGVAQPARTIIDITASQLAQTSFVTGSVGDALQIRASDGNAWSAGANDAWAPFMVTVPVNHPPVVTTSNISAAHGQTLALSSLFSVSDADGDAITAYELFDGNSDPNSGHFVVNGVAQPARTIIDITASQLAQTSFVTGSVGDALQIRASDGNAWSAGANDAWAPFMVTVPTNHPPVVTTSNISAAHGQTLALSSLFSVSDADGDAITAYELFDGNSDPSSGHFVVNGVAEPATTIIDITASQLAQTSFVAGFTNDTLQIRASDGYDWSAGANDPWAPFTVTVPVNHPPVVTTSNISAAHGQTLALPSLFSVSDADGDAITAYELFDGNSDPSSGHFVVNGVAQPATTIIDITASQLAQTSFVTGSVGDALQIRAFDGASWSAAANVGWAPFHINVS